MGEGRGGEGGGVSTTLRTVLFNTDAYQESFTANLGGVSKGGKGDRVKGGVLILCLQSSVHACTLARTQT